MYKINWKNIFWLFLSIFAGMVLNFAGIMFLSSEQSFSVFFTILGLFLFFIFNMIAFRSFNYIFLFIVSVLNFLVFAFVFFVPRFIAPYLTGDTGSVFSGVSINEAVICLIAGFISVRVMLKKNVEKIKAEAVKTCEQSDIVYEQTVQTKTLSEEESREKTKIAVDIAEVLKPEKKQSEDIKTDSIKDYFNPVIVKKVFDDSGEKKISSVGKLLINHRDLENIIETNALLQHFSGSSSVSGLISAQEGETLKKSVESLMSESSFIKDIFIMSASGFPVYSTSLNNRSLQAYCALFSSAFAIIEDHFSKIIASGIVSMVVETDETSVLITKSNGRYAAFLAASEALPVNYAGIRDILSNSPILGDNLNDVKTEKILDDIVITDKKGKTLNSAGIENAEKISFLSVIVLDNLNSLLKDILSGKIKKIFVFTLNKVIIFRELNDRIVTLTLKTGSTVKLSEQSAKIVQLIKQG
jgi:predicted regulator of Ras-like GTPase activity (Roadblock/LC7/MglB family)